MSLALMRRESEPSPPVVLEGGRGPVISAPEADKLSERMALGLGATSHGLMSYELLFINTDHQMYVYII